MILFPNCKINLGLNIILKRPDGFHDLETLFYPVSLHDALEIIPSADGVFEYHSTGLAIPGEVEQNLCIKAYRMLQQEYDLPDVKMHLHKVIPIGAGLGGGSSDGAFTIILLNQLFGLKLSTMQMENYARNLGSDCTFFIGQKPVYASGLGDRFTQCSIDLPGYHLVVVKPDVHVATADAYALLSPKQPASQLSQILSQPIGTWKAELVNDFEEAVFSKYPVIGEIKLKLYDAGAIYASMSGSGSAVYGLFKKIPQVEALFPGCFVWISQRL